MNYRILIAFILLIMILMRLVWMQRRDYDIHVDQRSLTSLQQVDKYSATGLHQKQVVGALTQEEEVWQVSGGGNQSKTQE